MKGVLFDMDGVLVDVTESYRQTIKATAEYFLKEEISLATIQQYKNRGGLNNDWDLTYTIIKEGGLAIEKERVIEVFQRYYLGTEWNGLINREGLLIDPTVLVALSQGFKTGIVTGRPLQEAIYTLERFNIRQYFEVIITMDDLPPEKGKPDPMGLQLAKERLEVTEGWYLGDTVDDMQAAVKANLTPIGICGTSTDQQEISTLLTLSGASTILKTANDFFPCPESPVSPVNTINI